MATAALTMVAVSQSKVERRRALIRSMAVIGLYAVVVACGYRAVGRPLGNALQASIAPGIVIAVLSGLVARRARRESFDAATATLTPQQRDLALAASRHGPVPDEREVLAAAHGIAQWRASSDGARPWVLVAAFGAAAVGLGVAGLIFSPWWWGSAIALGLLTLLLDRALRRRAARFTLLSKAIDESGWPPGLRVDNAPRTGGQEPAEPTPEGVLHLEVHPPAGGWATSTSPRLSIDNRQVPVLWGHNAYVLPSGRHRIKAEVFYFWDFGSASVTIEVIPGATAQLHYSPPAMGFLDGAIGTTRQPTPSARALVITMMSFAALVLVLASGVLDI